MYTKMELLVWNQHKLENNVLGRPVHFSMGSTPVPMYLVLLKWNHNTSTSRIWSREWWGLTGPRGRRATTSQHPSSTPSWTRHGIGNISKRWTWDKWYSDNWMLWHLGLDKVTLLVRALFGSVRFSLGLDTLMLTILGLNWMSSFQFNYQFKLRV